MLNNPSTATGCRPAAIAVFAVVVNIGLDLNQACLRKQQSVLAAMNAVVFTGAALLATAVIL